MSDRISKRQVPPKTNFDLKIEGLSLDDVGEATSIVSSHHVFTGTPSTPVVPPIYNASTYVLDQPEDLMACVETGGACYSRLGNPTTEALDAAINVLERGAGSLTFSSGMAGVTSVMIAFLQKGDHVVMQIPSYPGSLTFLKQMVDCFGVEWTKIRDADFESVKKATKPNTKMIWLETPCNPEIVVVDIRRMTDYAKSKNILVAVDGTFASPYAQKAIELGADFSIHSCTKYLGGHSDLMAGCVTTRTVEQWRIMRHTQSILGNMMLQKASIDEFDATQSYLQLETTLRSQKSPHDASLLHRSIKTLPIRMERTSDTALKVAEFLEKHPKVSRVHYPGLPSHPQHKIAVQQMKVFSGMIMADIKGGGEGGRTLAQNIKVIKMAVSLGGVDSLLEHPYSMTHGPYLLTDEEREESCVTPGMVRISIGLEDPDDLIRDLDQALSKVDV